MPAIKVLSASTANAGGSTIVNWMGGLGTFIAQGTFASGTLKLQQSVAGSTWEDCSGTALTANGSILFELPPGVSIRPILSGSTTGVTINAWIHGEGVYAGS